MNCWQLLTAVCLLWLTAAQSRAEAPAGFDVHVWGVDEGLPQSAVLTLTQTRDGYLWIGTLDGLARFDGIRFTTFREANTPGLTSSRILTLFEDSQRNLWIGTETAGVFLIKDGRVISLDIGRGTRQGSLMSASEDQSGAVWLYTADGQLCRYQSNRVDVWNAGAGRASNCRAVITDNSGLTWVGTDWTLTAIGKVPPGPAVALPVVHEFQFPVIVKLEALLASKSGGYWRLANGRIEKWQGDQRQKDLGPYPWAGTNNVPVRAVCEDLEGNLIVGTHGDGVYWFDAEGSYTHLSTNIQVNASVLSLAMDREGCLWVGSNGGGLARIRKQFFQTLDSSRGSTVQTVAADRQGGIWIGYNEQRVDHWTPQRTLSFTNFQTALDPYAPRLGDWFVRSVFFDSAQRVWAGTLNGGLLRLSDGFFRPEPGPGALRKDVAAIYEDRSSRLWAGTAGGLAGWDGTNWTVYNQTNGLSANTVRAIVEDREGALWVGTDAGGLNRLHNGRFDWFGKTNGLPSDNISALLADNEGALWVGTASGLARGRDGQWTSFAERLGPAANSVAYLLEDGAGHLWIGSTAGLLRVPKKDLNELASSTRTLFPRLYGRADGLPASECTQGSQPAACRTADGRVYFPTIQGVASASLDSLRPNTNPPPVMIEAVYIDSQMQGATSLRAKPAAEVTVRPGNNALEIQFTSLNLAYPEKARFRYRLEPYETGWNEVGTDRRFARYPKLPPGNYVFEVTACNEDRFWNPAPASLAVVVLPPFWRTWWFVSLSTLALLALIVGSVHYVSTQKLQRQLSAMRQQEALEKERARIARDLHDQLGANLTQVALLGEMAESDKELPEEIENHARQISQTARDTTRALDEIVWTVNPSNDTLDGLINYTCKYAQEYLALAGLRYRLEVPPSLPNTPISPELRHNVFLAAKEAVNNIVKHSKASAAWLRLELASDRFTFEIEDNGRGISPADQAKGRNGLRNMRRRMEDINGSFQSGPGAEGGTRIRLTAPLRPTETPSQPPNG